MYYHHKVDTLVETLKKAVIKRRRCSTWCQPYGFLGNILNLCFLLTCQPYGFMNINSKNILNGVLRSLLVFFQYFPFKIAKNQIQKEKNHNQ
jgi:hypothetical protein